jgi:hypothetical protein
MSTKELRSKISADVESAFGSQEHPGDENLIEFSGRTDPDLVDLASAFRDRDWRELDQAFLARHYDALFFFTPPAFRFYLPAYILHSLEFESSGMIGPTTVDCLVPPPHGIGLDPRWFNSRVQDLKHQQVSAICSFLEYLVTAYGAEFLNDEPRLALETYWSPRRRRGV